MGVLANQLHDAAIRCSRVPDQHGLAVPFRPRLSLIYDAPAVVHTDFVWIGME
jgi:hypothetical protein